MNGQEKSESREGPGAAWEAVFLSGSWHQECNNIESWGGGSEAGKFLTKVWMCRAQAIWWECSQLGHNQVMFWSALFGLKMMRPVWWLLFFFMLLQIWAV